jgi:hypothetical protein
MCMSDTNLCYVFRLDYPYSITPITLPLEPMPKMCELSRGTPLIFLLPNLSLYLLLLSYTPYFSYWSVGVTFQPEGPSSSMRKERCLPFTLPPLYSPSCLSLPHVPMYSFRLQPSLPRQQSAPSQRCTPCSTKSSHMLAVRVDYHW